MGVIKTITVLDYYYTEDITKNIFIQPTWFDLYIAIHAYLMNCSKHRRRVKYPIKASRADYTVIPVKRSESFIQCQ